MFYSKKFIILAGLFLSSSSFASEEDNAKIIAIQQAQIDELKSMVEGLATQQLPRGSIMAFDLKSCPVGWEVFAEAKGRAMVGYGIGGTAKGTVGSPLKDLENRTHSHSVNPAVATTTYNGNHRHRVDPPNTTTSFDGSHNHIWSRFSNSDRKRWYTYDSSGSQLLITNWDDGIHNNGSGRYPMIADTSRFHYTTKGGSHRHSINISSFNSYDSGTHNHQVDIAKTASSSAYTSNVMPYLQILYCKKQ